MATSSTPANPASLAELYRECIQAFRAFLLAVGEEDCRVIHLEQIHLPEILEEYGRAKIWGDQTKADLPERARGSLDDTLRHDSDLKQLVEGIFMRLRGLLRQATSIAEKKYNSEAGSDYDSVSSVSADSDSDSDDDADARRSMPKIRLLIQQIVGQIRSLYDLSSLLRRPKIADKYIRSINSKLGTLTSGDSETLPLSVGFRVSDENHVVEKVLQWRGLTKAEKNVIFEEEGVATTRESLITDGVDDILWFCQRLAQANTRRREQLQYWSTHPYDPKKEIPSATQLSSQDPKEVEEAQELRSQASTLKPPNPNLPRPGPRSAVSKQSFSTAAVSLLRDSKTNIRPKTVYAPTAIGKGRSNSVPDPPEAKDDSVTFLCPYCGMTLEYSEMQNKQSWQRHVFRDLRPYVCMFKECHNAGKLYVSRHDWIHHELQVHRREYVCKECEKKCQTRQEASAHIQEHHGKTISSDWLNVILDLSERQVDVFLEKELCLICGEELSLKALQDHVASHMEDIALFVLPNTEEDDETGDSKASVRVAKLESKGKASDISSHSGSHGFSTAGDNERTPLDFAKILRDEEAGYADKFSYWETEDDTEEPAADMAERPDDIAFNPEEIASRIAKALRGNQRAPDKEPLLQILPGLSHEEVMGLRTQYKAIVKTGSDHKGINVAKHIRLRLRDEDPKLMKACYAVALGQWESEAYWTKFWYQGDKTRRELLIESLMGRTNEEIQNIKEGFSDKTYGNSLTKCMETELEDKFKKVVLLVLNEERMEEVDEYGRPLRLDLKLVNQDVEDLLHAVESDKGGETLMISIVVLRSDAHLREVLKEYAAQYRSNFARDALKKSTNLVGEVLAHILHGVINKPVRDALLLHHALTASRKDELRSELLTSRLVRCHWDRVHMEAVKREYAQRYDVELSDAVRDATSAEWGIFCGQLCIARTPNAVTRVARLAVG